MAKHRPLKPRDVSSILTGSTILGVNMIFLDYCKHLIKDKENWEAHKNYMEQQWSRGGLDHRDDPARYPCIVSSHIQENQYGQDWCYHFFVYQDEAFQLSRINLDDIFEKEVIADEDQGIESQVT